MSLPSRNSNAPRFATIHSSANRGSGGINSQPQASAGGGGGYEEQSIGSRCMGCIRAIPIVTASAAIIMTGLFIWTAIMNSSHPNFVVSKFANCPARIINLGEWWRLFTPGFFHLGVLHIILNMLMSLFISTPIERAIGSLGMLGLIFVFSVVPQILYTGIFYLIYAITGDISWIHRCAAGYSAHLFGYIVIMIVLFNLQNINFCGCFDIPASVYPWFLLLITSLMNSSSSLVGHLSGLLTAYLYIYGLLGWFSLPRKTVLSLEQFLPNFLRRSTLFSPTPEVQNALLYDKSLPFTRRVFSCGPNVPRGGNAGSNDADRSYFAASARHGGGRSAEEPSQNPPRNISTYQGSSASSSVFSGPGHVLGSAAASSTPSSNAHRHHARNVRVLPIASPANPVDPVPSAPVLSPERTAAAPQATAPPSQQGASFVRSPGRKKGGYSELVNENTDDQV